MEKRFLLPAVLTLAVFGFAMAAPAYDALTGDRSDDNSDRPVKKKDVQAEPAYPPYHGPKKRIAVTKFENKVTGMYGNWNLGEGFSEMLITELVKTDRFVVVERHSLQDILGEQELGQSGLVRKETAARVGQVLGAQMIVRGVVSEFEQRESGGDSDFKYKGFSLGAKTSQAHVGIDIRLIDTTTGQILHSHNAVGNAQTSALKFGVEKGETDFNIEGFKNSPLGEATRQAIHDAVQFIILRMRRSPLPPRW